MILRLSLLQSLRLCSTRKVNYSTSPDELTFFMNDMAICWHKEPKFPYECTRPLPDKIPEAKSVLKVSVQDAYKIFQPEKSRATIAEEMAKITYTTKHPWFPRSRDNKLTKVEPDRPYL